MPPALLGLQTVIDMFGQVDEDQKDDFGEKDLSCIRSLRTSKEALIEVLQGTPASKLSSTVTALTYGQGNPSLTSCGKE